MDRSESPILPSEVAGTLDPELWSEEVAPHPSSSAARRPESTAAVVIRLPSELIKLIDAAVNARPIRMPRHTWLLEAIHEKLARESGPGNRKRVLDAKPTQAD